MEKLSHLVKSLEEREQVENYLKNLSHEGKVELLNNIIKYIERMASN